MQALLNTAIKAARKAGDIAQMNFDRINESDIKTKGYNEFVTFVDIQAETAIKEFEGEKLIDTDEELEME